MQSSLAAAGPGDARAAEARPSLLQSVPLWAKLVTGIGVLLVATWSLMITLAYVQQREAAIAQARDFAESANQMTVATITAMMITKVSNERGVYLDQIRNTRDIKEIKVLRYGSVIAEFGPGKGSESAPTPEEKAAMESGRNFFQVDGDGKQLLAIFPMLNLRNYLGKDCIACHAGREGEVVGAVSMRVSLAKPQADLRQFTWSISLLALGLCVPLLGAIYGFIRRHVAKPLGGEPAVATEVANRIAAGDLTVEVPVASGDTASLMAAMAKMRASLAAIIERIRVATETISAASGDIAAGNIDLSQRTEEQATSLEETASSMEQLAATVKQNAGSARRANELAAGASEVAKKGGEVVRDVVRTMGAISDSSRRIAEIIGVIDSIAFQTNILALNAAVEAARAGEQGRGFAVVASEVRHLAQRSAAAAKEIKDLIGGSVEQVTAGARLVEQAGGTMEEIVTAVKRVTDVMAEISAASQEQSSGIEQVSKAVVQMDHVVQQNATLVEQSAAAADSLQEQARALVEAVAAFRLARPVEEKAKAAAPRAAAASPARAAAAPALRRPAPAAHPLATAERRSAAARSGTDDSWKEF
jgi:methyl-accepting chemotaxis protein